MTFMIDLLKEVGLRLPKGLGQSIGFLGAVVIGQSAVDAGYVSPVVIIIVAVSAVSSFALPSLNLMNMSRMSNYILILLASILGLLASLWAFFIYIGDWLPYAHSAYRFPILWI